MKAPIAMADLATSDCSAANTTINVARALSDVCLNPSWVWAVQHLTKHLLAPRQAFGRIGGEP